VTDTKSDLELDPASAEKLNKLKEIESTLSQELNPKSSLSSASNVSPPGNSSPPRANTSGNKDEELSLHDVDDLLNDIDEGFKSSMDSITSELGTMAIEATGLESIPIGKDYLDEAKGVVTSDSSEKEDDDLAEEIIDELLVVAGPSGKTISEALSSFIKITTRLPIKIFQEFLAEIKNLKIDKPKDIVLRLLTFVLSVFKEWISSFAGIFVSIFNAAFEIDLLTYVKFIALLLVSGLLAFIVRDIFKNFRPDQVPDPFLKSFREVSKTEVLIREDGDNAIDNPFKRPEFVVSIARIVSNLKPVPPKVGSMLSLEFYVEASNQDAAIEIHERELEIKDLVERIAEQTTFAEIETKVGKEQFKSHIITSLNRILNKGRAKKIFFKNLQIKK
jgi:flagellar basal body-associated protein FliL